MTSSHSIPLADNLCLLNFSSEDVQGHYVYSFLCNKQIAKVIGDQPFSRGDVAEIRRVDPSTLTVEVRILEKEDLKEGVYNKLPVLLFARTRVYLNSNSNYTFTEDKRVKILFNKAIIKDDNLTYLLCLLYRMDGYAVIKGVDEKMNSHFEWRFSAR